MKWISLSSTAQIERGDNTNINALLKVWHIERFGFLWHQGAFVIDSNTVKFARQSS
jgi:hypothetical protein